jgi:hypothetical protein
MRTLPVSSVWRRLFAEEMSNCSRFAGSNERTGPEQFRRERALRPQTLLNGSVAELRPWGRTQDLDDFCGEFFVGVIRIAPIRVTFEAAHNSFIGFVEDRAEESFG